MFKTTYIDSIREYVPEAAKVVLDEQVQKVRQTIAEDIAQFGRDLHQALTDEVTGLTNEVKVDLQHINDLIRDMKSNDKLSQATEGLKSALDAFISKWKGLGEKVGAAVETAAKRALAL